MDPTSADRERGGRWRTPGRFLRDLNILALLVVIAAGAALLLLPGSDDGLLGLPELTPGEEAPRTIKSPRAFVIADLETTERLRREAIARVRPTYDLLVALGTRAKDRIEAAFSAAVSKKADEPESDERRRERARAFMLGVGVTFDEQDLLPLLKAGQVEELRDAAIMVAQAVYEKRIVEDKVLLMLQAPTGLQVRLVEHDGSAEQEENVFEYGEIIGLDEARAYIDDLVAERLQRLKQEQRRAVAILVKRLLKPNLLYNAIETERRKRTAESAVKTIVTPIKPGETVLRVGERVTERHLFVLRGIEKELREESRVQAAAGSAVLIVLLVILVYGFSARAHRSFRPSHRDLAFLASSYIGLLLFTWMGYKAVLYFGEVFPELGPSAYRFVLPLSAGALLVRLVVGAEAAAAFTPLAGLTVGWMMDTSLGYAAYVTAGSFAAAAVVDTSRPRAGIFVAGLRAALAQIAVVVSLALLASRFSFEETGPEILAALVSGLVSSLMVLLIIPPVEVVLGYTTAMKLTDLANLNHPLLRELLIEAPGTYNHSIMVGTLAEAGAKAVGADGLLARVGAYYHDIGKIRNPRVFSENDRSAFPNVPPVEMAQELRLHIAEGLEIAGKHRLGQPIMEIIAQHHGTSLVRGSFRKALDLSSVGASEEANLRYPGPKPLSREAGIVLLADVVEKSTVELGHQVGLERQDIEAQVRRTVNEITEDGQLDACDLSLREVNVLIFEFTSVLEDRYLRRGRPTLSALPMVASTVVRAPAGGEPN